MFGPDFGSGRTGCLVAVIVRLYTGTWIVTQVTVHVDDSRCHIFAGAIDHDRAFRRRQAGADRLNLATRMLTLRISVGAPG
jgi:hypothetical protein